MIRLQKVLADRGVASRRHAEDLIASGRVRVEGEVVATLGTRVPPDARIEVDGVATRAATARYIALNKPEGVVSTARDERGRRTVVDLVGGPERLYPVGRLDADSQGLLLLTNDGEWAERVLHPRYGHEREYEVTVTGELTAQVTTRLRRGVRLEEGPARAERVEVVTRSRSASRLRVVLRTGWKRQIRRMCAAVGLRVTRLVRVRIGGLALGRLRPGEWRELSPKEIADLAKPIERAPARGDKRGTNNERSRRPPTGIGRGRARRGAEGPRARGVPVPAEGRGSARREGFGAATRRSQRRTEGAGA